ncbi:hypothetical protein [Ferruginibacter sp.]
MKAVILSMKKTTLVQFFFAALLLYNKSLYAQQAIQLNIQPTKPTTAIQPTMWGIFFEDINFAADGGLYAELVKNRSFEFPMPMMGWREIRDKESKGKVLIENISSEATTNLRFARITADGRRYGISNEGFRGMGIYANTKYVFSLLVRNNKDAAIKIRAQVLNASGKIIGETLIDNLDNDWRKRAPSSPPPIQHKKAA